MSIKENLEKNSAGKSPGNKSSTASIIEKLEQYEYYLNKLYPWQLYMKRKQK